MRPVSCICSAAAAVALLAGCWTDSTAPAVADTQKPLFSIGADAEFFGRADISIDQATHQEGFGCGLGPAGGTTDSREVTTPSGNVNLVCHGQTAVGPPETVVLNDVLCGTSGGVTTNSQLVWTKSGHATLTCHFKPA